MGFRKLKFRGGHGDSERRNLQQIRRRRDGNWNWSYWETCGFCADAFFGCTGRWAPNRERFVCAVNNKPIPAGYTKTGAYVGQNRKLDAWFRVKCFQWFVETNASAPMVQLQSIRVVLDVIAYRKWNYREMDVPKAFLRRGALERETYSELPGGVETKNISCGLPKPRYGLITACQYWYVTIRDCLS